MKKLLILGLFLMNLGMLSNAGAATCNGAKTSSACSGIDYDSCRNYYNGNSMVQCVQVKTQTGQGYVQASCGNGSACTKPAKCTGSSAVSSCSSVTSSSSCSKSIIKYSNPAYKVQCTWNGTACTNGGGTCE